MTELESAAALRVHWRISAGWLYLEQSEIPDLNRTA